ncbi:MAG: tRNA (guanosine(37)-N1)-methyltransferase TrmD [Verrucomicrobia bacterium]|nr:tRNA (guanosine(37)-N1)-methyltransferase TrmD [Verrucomicrobiota bacterium]
MSSPLRIDILTLFPAMLSGFISESMVGRAIANNLIEVRSRNLRDWCTDKWQITDDRPFGGGAGMVMKPEPLFAAIEDLEEENSTVIYMTPDGEPFSTDIARDLASEEHLILVSGHYEGIDQRVRDAKIHREISIGDYVLTNGTLPAAVLVDAVARWVPGVLGEEKSLTQDSFYGRLLGFPQYTRPVEFRGMPVPPVLLSGNHSEIEKWRAAQRLEKTIKRRPDLLNKPVQS